ncbi:phage tail protein [Erwinia sp. S63]|uniref:phage tail protein n=1 Tax=Erwinia sp. S63 TaxID=2769341 RepID=UPI00190C6116|nr:phage tail protein [Erwinia sp. S63]MBK0095279.1 phage tail protein [Erwinia sp. S63]
MHRIDTSTAQVDKFGSGKNGFTGGNPQTGELPTALDADYFDSLQEELAAVIEAAGITLDKNKNNQLYTAIKSQFNAGRLIGIKVITSSGLYIPSVGAKKGKARAVGGGAGGGGGPAAGSSQQSCAQGGQCGSYAEVLFDISAASYAVTIGAAGVAGTASAAGTAGGATTLAGIFSCPGGSPGSQGIASSATITVSNNAANSTYATISSGTALINLPASPGEPFIVLGVLSGQLRGGRGGSNPFGIGGSPGAFGPGTVGRGFGSGGGGCSQGQGGAGDVGGAGLPGIMVIEEYA